MFSWFHTWVTKCHCTEFYLMFPFSLWLGRGGERLSQRKQSICLKKRWHTVMLPNILCFYLLLNVQRRIAIVNSSRITPPLQALFNDQQIACWVFLIKKMVKWTKILNIMLNSTSTYCLPRSCHFRKVFKAKTWNTKVSAITQIGGRIPYVS